MCTVSVIGVRGRIRLACNRDELRARPQARPPALYARGGVRAILPIDPASGGTWIAATDAGLAFALLNVNTGVPERIGNLRSRGEIIPALLECQTVTDVVDTALTVDPGLYRPFRVVIAGAGVTTEVVPAERVVRQFPIESPAMFTSSALGDHRVEGPRRALFRRLAGSGRDLVQAQDRFHTHQWLSRPHVSVRMARADARTVSRTTIELDSDAVAMTYVAEPGGGRSTVVLEGVGLDR